MTAFILRKQILSALHRYGPMSRFDLHKRTGIRVTTVGDLTSDLIERGVLREGEVANTAGRGRPKVLLEFDPSRASVVGINIETEVVSVCAINLFGEETARMEQAVAPGPACTEIPKAIKQVVPKIKRLKPLSIGVSAPGLIDLADRKLLMTGSPSTARPIELDGLRQLDQVCPVNMESGIQALAAQWQVQQKIDPRDDLVMVVLNDGAIGAAVLINGSPNRGCVGGANELGLAHTFTSTGEVLPLQSVFSTRFADRLANELQGKAKAAHAKLLERFEGQPGDAPATREITEHVAVGIANTLNLIRPVRLVITGEVISADRYVDYLLERTEQYTLDPIWERLHVSRWRRANFQNDPTPAGFVALREVFYTGDTDHG